MDTEWSIEAGLDAPVIAIPWEGGGSSGGYVDLVADGGAFGRILEAQQWPEVLTVLQKLNGPRSAWQTVKCDAWELDEEEKQLDFEVVAFGFGAYFDIVARSQSRFRDLALFRSDVERWTLRGRSLQPSDARAVFVVRPAYRNDEAGYAVTIYVYGYGATESDAHEHWSAALDAITVLIEDESA